MTYARFMEICGDSTLHAETAGLPQEPLLQALWHDRHGHWDIAHQIAQSIGSPQGSALHAYLHREEGDLSNAQYWYSRAGRQMVRGDLSAEWNELAREFSENS